MAHKYLLYIHNDAFANEQSKSGLVNQLLEQHYSSGSVYTVSPISKPDVYTVQPSFERRSNGLCKVHGTPLDGRGKCLQKDCKYA